MQDYNSMRKSRQRKALLLLPVVAIPILCCSFYVLGGGQGDAVAGSSGKEKDHFNAQLPDAHFNKRDALVDKLGFYEKADEDSMKRELRMRADPYHVKDGKEGAQPATERVVSARSGIGGPAILSRDTTADRLLEKLERLKKIVSAPTVIDRQDTGRLSYEHSDAAALQMSRLEGMMNTIKSSSTQDPQISKLDAMLDKIIKIQHPELAKVSDTARRDSADNESSIIQAKIPRLGSVYDVDSLERAHSIGGALVTGFQDIDAGTGELFGSGIVIPGVVPDDQTLVTGATIKLRTKEEANVGDLTIPKNSLLYGKVSISGERMLVSIGSLRIGTGLYTVDFQVFDMDGMPGIRIPGAIDRDVAKESAEQGVSSIGAISTIDQSLGAQAATAGVQAAKTLFSRKVKLVRAEVKAGYPVLIKNVKNK
jgi:conjugative transposon TraM protein